MYGVNMSIINRASSFETRNFFLNLTSVNVKDRLFEEPAFPISLFYHILQILQDYIGFQNFIEVHIGILVYYSNKGLINSNVVRLLQ